MFRLVCLLAAAAAVLPAQIVPVPPFSAFSPLLRSYLELKDDQVTSIVNLNSDLARYNTTKSLRMAQVQLEIQAELRRESLDAMALGLRYLELEVIRREMQAEQEKTVAAIQKVLTPAQQAKLQTLQEALRLYPVACEAITQNVMTSPASTETGYANVLIGLAPNTYNPYCGVTGTRTGLVVFNPTVSSTQPQ